MPQKAPTPRQPFPRWRSALLALLLTAFLASLFVFGDPITAFLRDVGIYSWNAGTWLLDLFGVVPAVIALAILAFLAFKGWVILLRRWHRWMGLIVLTLALAGLLSFIRPTSGFFQERPVAGALGKLITGDNVTLGILRVVVLTYLGLLLLAPGVTMSRSRAAMKIAGKGVGRVGTGGTALVIAVARAGTALLRGLTRRIQAAPKSIRRTRTPEGRDSPPHIEPAQALPPVVPPPTPTLPIASSPPQAEETIVREYRPQATEPAKPEEATPLLQQEQPIITPSGWQLPTQAILDPVASTTIGPGDMDRRAETLQKALAEYGVEARVVAWNVGPTVTQYEVEPGFDIKYKEVKEKDSDGNLRISRQEVSRTRVKVDRITALGNDLALALAAPSIRIEAPVPGKSIVGIEVPNSSLGVVPLRTVLESSHFQRLRGRSRLALALGKGVGGEPVVADLTRMPHILIAGATGSGKSVCINSLICCLALHNTPEELKMVLIDPKRVEFTSFNTLPHLAMRVIVDREKAVEALRWLAKEMDERYKTLANAGARNIEDYNRSQRPGWPLPYIVLFVDELADLMTTAFEETEKNLCRLAQLARATGIHLVVATQRPSVDVVTGLIKANFPTRISFALSSQMDSRTILDTGGAEKLLGRGDMLYLPTDAARPKRLQGCYLSDSEIERLVAFWRRQRTVVHPAPPPAPSAEQPTETQTAPKGPETPADPLLEAARRLAREHQHISASFLQRRLQVGSFRAVKLMELLEEEGAITGGKKTEPEE